MDDDEGREELGEKGRACLNGVILLPLRNWSLAESPEVDGILLLPN